MKEELLNEQEFFYFHEQIKRQGGYIIRCMQISGNGNGKYYKLIWITKA